jgi:hypothetical protein
MAVAAQDPGEDMYDIPTLRRPLFTLTHDEQQKLKRLQLQHEGVTEDFLHNHLVPRYIVFIDSERNMLQLSRIAERDLIPRAEFKQMVRNVVINVNYYIAKYDFEIANKIRPTHE